MENIFQFATIVVTLILAACMRGRPKARLFRRLYVGMRRVAQRRRLAIVLVGLLSFALNAGFGLSKPHLPRYHDEFSYLLAADTFAHGRVTNPTHPFWQHFETFHVIQQPTYQSKFPPAFGMMLALAIKIGLLALGPWLCLSLGCAAVCWMLQGWLRPFWAFLGGLLLAINGGIIVLWGQTFWTAGGLCILGGALVYGALRRIVEKPNAFDTFLFGFGLLVLAHTRPYEGLVVSLPAIGALLVCLFSRRKFSWPQIIGRVVLPGLISIAVIVGTLGFYNWQVTGNALRFPYQIHEETYASTPLFVFQKEKPLPPFRHAMLRDFQVQYSQKIYRDQQTPARMLVQVFVKLKKLGSFFLNPPIILAFCCLPWVLRDRWMRLAAFAIVFELLGILLETFINLHYFAPATPLLTLLLTRSLQHLRAMKLKGRPFGRMTFRGVIFTLSLALVLTYLLFISSKPQRYDVMFQKAIERNDIIRRLKSEGGKHLILVQYARDHVFHFEWVYNDADIDRAAIVWARPMSPEKNAALIDYFSNHKVWLLSADANPAQLKELKRIPADNPPREGPSPPKPSTTTDPS